MYYVKLFDKQNNVVVNQPFSDKNAAIKYFNLRCDAMSYALSDFMDFHRIEIGTDNCILFDYEV